MRWERHWEPVESGPEPAFGHSRPEGPATGPEGAEPEPTSGSPTAIEAVVEGELVENQSGAFYRATERHAVGIAQTPGWPDAAARRALTVACHDLGVEDFELGRAIFIDTETTGLAGGTGTYAFLVGCGWVEDGALRVDQFFMRDQADEPAMMAHLAGLLRRFDWTVSFNGMAFDLPLLQTRFIMNRMRFSVEALGPLGDRSLDSLERHVLGVRRRSDVPSHLIPEIYFRYLRSGDARMLRPVFDHNRQDIVSLALLLERACETCTGWRGGEPAAADVLGVARAHALAGDLETAAEAYARALELGLEAEAEVIAQTHLSLQRKRWGVWSQAAGVWAAMAAREDRAAIWALVELAKYREHRQRDFAAARACTLRALELAAWLQEPLPLALAEPALRYRLGRLERQLALLR